MKAWATIGMVGLLLLCASGCKKDEPMADTAPFQAAIAKYLAARSMDMKVVEFQSPLIDRARKQLAQDLGIDIVHGCACFEGYCAKCKPSGD
jgi:hypothetical protein